MSTSNTPNDGGPAFPGTKSVTATCPDSGRVQETYTIPHGGMSLRDWFAGQALAGIIATTHADLKSDGVDVMYGETDDGGDVAHEAYAIADAMLAARNKNT
jgi:hypothetical protein